MPKVFISYRRNVSAMLAQLIMRELERQGVEVFLDTRAIDGAGPFPRKIRRAIREADVLVCLLAATTLDSEWVQEEVRYAHAQGKTLIPVFQESYRPPPPPHPEHIAALLSNQGVPVLDQRNIYIDDALRDLLALVRSGPGETPWPTSSGSAPTRPPRQVSYYRFWGTLLDRARQRTPLHAHIAPGKRNAIYASAGLPGLKFGYALHRDSASVCLYIDRGDRARNKALFDHLAAHKAEIEAAFGAPLEWERMEPHRASRVRKTLPIGDRYDEAQWPRIHDAMIDAMLRLESALRPWLGSDRNRKEEPKQVDLPPHDLPESEKWNSYYREFADKSDRATAIVGALMLEAGLDKAISNASGSNGESRKKPRGLGSKIEEAYHLELISETQKQDLHAIRSIRNYFVHELSASSFEEPVIREQCQTLQIGRRFVFSKEPKMRELFVATVAALMYWLSTN